MPHAPRAVSARPRRPGLRALAVASLVGLAGCAANPAAVDPPCPHYNRAAEVIDAAAPPGTYPPVDPAIAASLADRFADPPGPGAPPAGPPRPINVLALSGGGQYGAYLGGVLVGWSQRGDRPQFDVVTGISSGALLAAMAFGGAKYDQPLQEVLTNLSGDDLYKYRPVTYLLRYKSLASSDPLEGFIARYLTDAYMDDLRAGHREGRRLFVGTMNIQARRLVVWDLGALASCGRRDANCLVRQVLLAACSIPGLVPAVEFDVTVDGKRYTERHGDGGAVSQIFVRFGPNNPRYAAGGPAGKWLAGSNLYLFTGGKLYADPLAERPGFVGQLSGTVSGTLYALYRAELMKYYALCQASGMGYNVLAIPQDLRTATKSVAFDTAEMRRLFSIGFERGKAGVEWRRTPPNADPGEEEIPRAGLEFNTAPRQ